MAKEEPHETLGRIAIPINYRIKFTPDLKTFKFIGEEQITIVVAKKTDTVRLNAANMKVSGARVIVRSKEVTSKSIVLDKQSEQLTLKFPEKFSGRVELLLKFQGENNDKMFGFYRSKYGDGKHILTSQFEAADARSAFPCFDEPEFKATFDVSFVIPKNMQAISNTEPLSEKAIGPKKEVIFKTTPKMSTYLLYLGVGMYDCVEGKLGKLKIRVLTVPGKKEQAYLALGYAKKFVDYYQKYFGIDYPLPKLDLIAVPDFAAGAMENWGAITFREVALLGNDKDTPVGVKQQIAETIAHELAHQWFGDLVTMKWWNDLWLNESFATFMSYKAMDAVFPEWKMMKQYLNDTIAVALGADQYKSTHPISVTVNTPAQINEIFDEISYEKGGSVLYMLEDYVGGDVFRNGLNIYLKKHAYSNATKQDLWGAIDVAAAIAGKKLDTVKIATAWINKTGYPVVLVRSENRNVLLEQKRFLLVGEDKKSGEWPIPVHYLLSDMNQGSMVLNKKKSKLRMNSSEWVKINYTQSGLYRTVYEDRLLQGLGAAIKNRDLKEENAWGVENDLFAIARAGVVPVRDYIRFISSYCKDADYPLNSSISGHVSWLERISRGERWLGLVQRIDLEFHRGIISKIGWERKVGEDSITTMLRSAAITRMGLEGDKETLSRVSGMFDKMCRGDDKSVDPNLRSCVYTLSAHYGDAKTYDKLISMYKKAKMPDEKRRLLGAFSNFGSRDLIKKALEFSLSKEVRMQDMYVIAAITSANPAGTDIVWDWTKSNWQLLKSRFNVGTHMLARFVENAGVMTTKKEKDDLLNFFQKKENMRDDLKKALTQTAERIDANIQMLENNRKSYSD